MDTQVARPEGNLLVYSTDGLRSAVGEPVARQYLNHGHEAMFASDPVGAPVFVHEAERAAVTTAGGPFHADTDRADATRRIDAIIRRLRRGEAR